MGASSRSRPEPMAPVDIAWLRMDDPTNLMMVTALLSFDQRLDPDRLARVLEHRLLCFDRFRQRVVMRGILRTRPWWETDPRFDISSHLRRIALPSPGDETALRELVGDLMSTPLDMTKPLWQIHLIENYRGACALLVRIHHCVADGIALMQVLLSLTEPAEMSTAPPTARAREPRPPRLLWPLADLATSVRRAYRLGACLMDKGLQVLLRPWRVFEMARAGTSSALAAGHVLLRPSDPHTILRGKLEVPKRAAWSEALPLTVIKFVGHQTGSTVNDVLLAAATGALRNYLMGRGETVEGIEIHAAVPVNLRPPEQPRELGNEFGLVFIGLPVGLADPLERLHEVRHQMRELKESPEAGVTLRILGALGTTPAELQRAFVEFVGGKTTAVITNVPGPSERVFLAGAPVRSIMFWVPMSGRVGLGLSILSYDGQVRLGVASDRGLIPDPETIATAFEDELERLVESARPAEPVNA